RRRRIRARRFSRRAACLSLGARRVARRARRLRRSGAPARRVGSRRYRLRARRWAARCRGCSRSAPRPRWVRGGAAASLQPFGGYAWLVDIGLAEAPDRPARTHALAAMLRGELPRADVVVGAGSVLISTSAGGGEQPSRDAMCAILSRAASAPPATP